EDVFLKTLKKKHQVKNPQLLLETWQIASKIIPQVNRFHWRNWDADWSVESCMARPMLGGFRDVFDFVNNPTMQGENLLNPEQYTKMKLSGKTTSAETPDEVVERLIEWAELALANCDMLEDEKLDASTNALVHDIKAMAYLGLYYAGKIKAATQLAFYQQTSNQEYKKQAVQKMKIALLAVNKYAEISNASYHPQMLARPGLFDWGNMVEETKKELDSLMNYRN
ncbi:MAG: hypothetical protein MI740_05750, partial [Halanaerobiales bacterium]|nr:hypothetical protein [Halanaerobiales bacterium]